MVVFGQKRCEFYCIFESQKEEAEETSTGGAQCIASLNLKPFDCAFWVYLQPFSSLLRYLKYLPVLGGRVPSTYRDA